MHPFYDYCWSRDKVYPLLGFEHFYDLSDFPGARMIGSYAGNCVSDESDFAKLIELFEAKAPGQPMFLFNVTMQNHGGYAQLINAPNELVHMLSLIHIWFIRTRSASLKPMRRQHSYSRSRLVPSTTRLSVFTVTRTP